MTNIKVTNMRERKNTAEKSATPYPTSAFVSGHYWAAERELPADSLRCVTWCPDTQPSTPCHLLPPPHHHGHRQQGRVHLLHAEGLRGPVQRLLHRALQHPAEVFSSISNIARVQIA